MRTDRRDEANSALHNFANAPKIQSVNAAVWENNRCLFSDPHKTHNLNYI